MLNFDFTVFLGDHFPKHGLLLVETMIIAISNPTEFMHDECGPSPRHPSLKQSQYLCLTNSLVFSRQKTHCLKMDVGAMRAFHSLTAIALC